jgi:hypothetical protein
MIDVSFTLDDQLYEVLRAFARLHDLTIEEALRQIVVQSTPLLTADQHDPLIGVLGPFGDDAPRDVASRADDIIHEDWQDE